VAALKAERAALRRAMARRHASNPSYEARVRASFARQGFMRFLGAEIVALAPGRLAIALDHRPTLVQHLGHFHGGVVATLADNAAGYAAFTLMPADASILTVEFKINFVAPAAGQRLEARAAAVKHGRTLTVCESRVYAGGRRPTLCANALVSLMALPGRADEPSAARPKASGDSAYRAPAVDSILVPANPEFAAAVGAVYRRQPFGTELGFALDRIAPGQSRFSLPFRADLTQQHGFFHGGVVATAADLAMGAAAGTLVPVGIAPATVEFKLNLLAPAEGDLLKAYGSVLRPGRTVTVCRADVTAGSAGSERLCATALGTMIAVKT
jgi:uncharacterized protein (TIGR00369 family)